MEGKKRIVKGKMESSGRMWETKEVEMAHKDSQRVTPDVQTTMYQATKMDQV